MKQIVVLLLELLFDTDSFVFLAAIQGLAAAADIAPSASLPILLDAFIDPERSLYQRAKLGGTGSRLTSVRRDATSLCGDSLLNLFFVCSSGSEQQLITSASRGDPMGQQVRSGVITGLSLGDGLEATSEILSDEQRSSKFDWLWSVPCIVFVKSG